nr:WavE lipopolysaccharide synthesis family protein [Burkholderia sp. WSM2230]
MSADRAHALTPITDEDITLVFQGAWTADARRHIERSREAMPGARVVVSTFTEDDASRAAMPDVEWVVSEDPGPLPAYKRGARAPLNNVNRQIVSSRAGLAKVKSKYAVKIRTDCALSSRAFADIYARVTRDEIAPRRVLASSIYTLHPDGIDALHFHLSDWFFFGPTERLSAYYDIPLMENEDAKWFADDRRHRRGSHYFARRYRARFAPEQYLTVEYAKRLGYSTPSFLNDTSDAIKESYLRFLGEECIVSEPQALGLEFEKYAHVSRSHYQHFNCVWGRDWSELFDAAKEATRFTASGLTRAPARQMSVSAHRRTVVRAMRRIDFLLPVIAITGLMPLVGDMLGFYRKLIGFKLDA